MENKSTSTIWYALRNTVWQRDFVEASRLLTEHPELRDFRNGIGETVLHFLAVENDMEGVAWLHKNGFDLNAKNEFGEPAFFEAAQLNYKELILWFLANGVNKEATNNYNQSIVATLQEDENTEMVEFLSEHLA